MTHVKGHQDADLHNEDGTHRSTPPTADGRAVELYESRLIRHLAAHDAERQPFSLRSLRGGGSLLGSYYAPIDTEGD